MTGTATRSKLVLTRILLLGITGGLSLGAHAGEAQHPNDVTTSVKVSYADLDLTSDAGVKALKDRIREAAAGACKEMNVRVPAEGSSVESCTRDAVKSAMVEADKVIAAKRGAK